MHKCLDFRGVLSRSGAKQKDPASRTTGGVSWLEMRREVGTEEGWGGLRAVRQHATDVDEVVGDYPETNPALHSVVTFVATTIQSVAPLEYADAAFAPGSPFLAVAEPALLLFPLAFGALGGAIG